MDPVSIQYSAFRCVAQHIKAHHQQSTDKNSSQRWTGHTSANATHEQHSNQWVDGGGSHSGKDVLYYNLPFDHHAADPFENCIVQKVVVSH